ncbi:MAG: hypothetical protein IT565_13665 [Rhodospirillales bacterium]|nr:hypothetical protein [Rhodospirillales bacterium]
MKRSLLVLPEWPVSARDVRRCAASLAINFPDCAVEIASMPSGRERHQANLDQPLLEYDRIPAARDYDVFGFIDRTGDGEALAMARFRPKAVYHFDFNNTYLRARVEVVGCSLDETILPEINAHIFTRLAPDGNGFFHYFPYSYLFRTFGLGPVNEFGLRVDFPLSDLVGRSPDHKVIAIFGGSSAWSLDCLHTEMFAFRLQEKLNAWAAETRSRQAYTVINLAQHGSVMLNEMIYYLLFCVSVKPDLVIGHDGFNDFAHAMFADPLLVNDWQINYQSNLEDWAQILHNTRHKPTYIDADQRPQHVNSPQAAIRAYVTRKSQFQRLVEGDGGSFIWGLQPFLDCKDGFAPGELEYLNQHQPKKGDGWIATCYRAMPLLYKTLVERVPLIKTVDFINFAAIFKRFGDESLMFVDFTHLTPEGDDVVAETYFRHLIEGIGSGRYFSKQNRTSP